MKLIFLGTGTSTGVPQIGCICPTCQSKDPRDKRLRCSGLLTINGVRILIDCGPDFREQMLRYDDFAQIDAILITHEHYDHVGGIDDVRPYCTFGDIHIYAEDKTAQRLRERLPYCFTEQLYPGVPNIALHHLTESEPFSVHNKAGQSISILPLRIMHAKMPILGYRIGNLAWITDMSSLPQSSVEALKGIDTLVVNALRIEPHISHQTLEEALRFAEKIGAPNTYLIHMSHQIGKHEEVEKLLPPNVHLAYDGLTITI